MSATDHLMPKIRPNYTGPAIAVAVVVAVHAGLYFAWGVIGKIVIPRFPPMFVHVVADDAALPKLPVQITVPHAAAIRVQGVPRPAQP